MLKKTLKCSSLRLAMLLCIVLFLCGCETWKGMKKDFEILAGWDKEYQDALW
ncbi:hypothetical protein ACFL2J_00025 [Candidatus Omnitrophota bacterium]